MTATATTPPKQKSLVADEPIRFMDLQVRPGDILDGALPMPSPELVRSIAAIGLLQPVILRHAPTHLDKYRIVAGRRRVQAIRILKWEYIDARVIIDTDLMNATYDVATITENVNRSRNPVCELSHIESLMKFGATEKDIAWATGIDIGTIRKLLRLQSLSKPLRELLDNGVITSSVAESVAKLGPVKQAECYAHYDETGKLTPKDVREIRMVQARAAVDALPDTLFPADPPTPVVTTSDIEAAWKEFIAPASQGGWYGHAVRVLDSLAANSPKDIPKSALDAMNFAANIFLDRAEAEAPDFLADDERVDVSDVVSVELELYDENVEGVTDAIGDH